YKHLCMNDQVSIWSLTTEFPLGHINRGVTIEVRKDGNIVQCRGFANRLPYGNEVAAVKRWANEHGLGWAAIEPLALARHHGCEHHRTTSDHNGIENCSVYLEWHALDHCPGDERTWERHRTHQARDRKLAHPERAGEPEHRHLGDPDADRDHCVGRNHRSALK